MNKSLVSIIMPVFNGEKTIQIAINSLFLQTYTNWKCIIVNDGSTDGTKKILDSLSDNRIVVIHLKENKGRGYARQIALDNTEGDYLAYLDADDFYHEDKLLKQVQFLEKNKDVALLGTRTMTYNSKFEPTSVRGTVLKTPLNYFFGDKMFLSMATAMVRLPEAKLISYNPKLNASEDRDYFSKYLSGKKYFILNDILLYYLVNESTTYKKILQYTGFEMLRGFTIFGKNNFAAFLIVSKSLFKWMVYLFTIPVLGTEFFIKRRGREPNMGEIAIYSNQKKIIDKL